MLPALQEAFTPEQLNKLQQMRKLLEPYQNLSQRATSGSDTASKLQQRADDFWRTFSLGSRVLFGVLKGGGVTRTAKDAVGKLSNDKEAVDALLIRALTDPDVAEHLLRRPTDIGSSRGEWNDNLFRLLGIQQATTEAEDQGEE